MLIDEVARMLTRLAPHGWRDLLLQVTGGALDISASDLRHELHKKLPDIHRDFASTDGQNMGFGDFAKAGCRAIEPRIPAKSLLFHALASPAVRWRDETATPLTAFPTLAELDTLENYIFASAPMTPEELDGLIDRETVAVSVFATEFRPADRLPDKCHADLCFSRCGISRVGTHPAVYDPGSRGFVFAVDKEKPHAFPVLPVRFAPYLALRHKGQQGSVPQRFRWGDEALDFWLPVYKLFPGDECLSGSDLSVVMRAAHVNEKLARLITVLRQDGYATGDEASDLTIAPFRFTDGIAEFSENKHFGPGVLAPQPHTRLVDPAMSGGAPVTLTVPENLKPARGASDVLQAYYSGLYLEPSDRPEFPEGALNISSGRAHAAPEIINARHAIEPDGKKRNLNDFKGVKQAIEKGGYKTQLFQDFTGDGAISVDCPQLVAKGLPVIPAYSIVSGPDFFPDCDQLELMEWWGKVPKAIRDGLWAVPPYVLCDRRYAPNLRLDAFKGASGAADKTSTALVVLPRRDDAEPAPRLDSRRFDRRVTSLPDGAAGVFDPGWDVTTDAVPPQNDAPAPQSGQKPAEPALFLSAYGLGSPFVEDVKLCAALGTYWPTVAPDATRTFQPCKYWPTVSPLTDSEIGRMTQFEPSPQSLPWDGVATDGLIETDGDGHRFVEYMDIDYVDYVDNALAGKFTAYLTAAIDAKDYRKRVLAMAWTYWGLGIRYADVRADSRFKKIQAFLLDKAKWSVLSFTIRAPKDAAAEFQTGFADTGVSPQNDQLFQFQIYRWGDINRSTRDFQKMQVTVAEDVLVCTDLKHLWLYRDATWTATQLPTS